MPNISQSPVYNLKVVLKETGLKADILRAWERRYDLPKPQRTQGGHRLYSEYDIETIKWLRARQAEGLSISRAVELWKELIQAGSDPLFQYSPLSTSPQPERLPASGTSINILRQEWLDANLAFDDLKADEILNQAFAIYPVETVCTEIIQQGIRDIGNYWYEDKASVQQEHFASSLASRRLETLISATPRPTRQQTVLIGCPPGEWHTLPIQLLSLNMRRRGLAVVYLGADIPIARLEETAAIIQPQLIVLAAQRLSTAATLQSAALALQGQAFSVAYGGLIFNQIPRLRERIPAHFLGENLDDAMHLIERLVVAPTAADFHIHRDEFYLALATLYQEMRPRIESGALGALQKSGIKKEYINQANAYFGDGLYAALILGDAAYLEADLEWVKKLLAGRKMRENSIVAYLNAYNRSMHQVMGESSAPITRWMDAYIAHEEGV